jgi:hypothetical protein
MRNPGREVQVKCNIAESTPKERQEQIDQQRAEADNEENEDTYIEDVTPTIHKNDIQTVNLIPGVTLEDDQAPGQLPTYHSRWTIRKMFSNIPIAHRSFGEAKTKALRYELHKVIQARIAPQQTERNSYGKYNASRHHCKSRPSMANTTMTANTERLRQSEQGSSKWWTTATISWTATVYSSRTQPAQQCHWINSCATTATS